MLDYKTYVRKFGTKDKQGQYHVSISEDVFDLLKRKDRFEVGFKNEITFALMEDVFVLICSSIMTNDKDGKLTAYKKLANLIERVLTKHKDSPDVLNQRYYKVSPSPEEKEMFVRNPLVNAKVDVTSKIAGVLSGLAKFYRAINTEVGSEVFHAILREKTNVLNLVYDQKNKNGALVNYPEVLSFVVGEWTRRIQTYESYSSSLKLINGGIRNVGRK